MFAKFCTYIRLDYMSVRNPIQEHFKVKSYVLNTKQSIFNPKPVLLINFLQAIFSSLSCQTQYNESSVEADHVLKQSKSDKTPGNPRASHTEYTTFGIIDAIKRLEV